MGLAIDSVAASITGAQAALTAATLANGDSSTVRSFMSPAWAKLEQVFYQATTPGSIRVRSPMMHDDVRGIMLTPGETPVQFSLPAEVGQQLYPQDTLTLEMSGGLAAETDVMVLSIYYQNLSGTSARLHSWGDISGNIKSIKPMEVDVAASVTAGQWNDVVITGTENLLHANTDYAVLGYLTDKPAAAIGIRGQDTGNLRITGPGVIRTLDTSDYFVQQSALTGAPHIPVFNSANKDSTYVSLIEATATQAHKVQLILAELVQPLSS